MCSFGSLCPLPLLWEGSFFFSPLNLEFDLMLVVVFFFFNSLRYLEFLVNRDLILRIWFYLFILLSFLVAFWGLEDKAFDCLLCYYGCWKRIERKKYSYSILQLARSSSFFFFYQHMLVFSLLVFVSVTDSNPRPLPPRFSLQPLSQP